MSGGEKTFTLAPWSICWTVENGERTGGHIVGDDGKGSTAPICDVPFFPRRRDPGETQANLHLIAAAPDLLAAAKRALAVLKAQGESVRPGNALGSLAAAIAKADGVPSAAPPPLRPRSRM